MEALENKDPNVPEFRNSNPIFSKIGKSCGLAVVHDLHRKLAPVNKNPPMWLCMAEDASQGYEQRSLRIAYKDFTADEILLDWEHHGGKKKAPRVGARGLGSRPHRGHVGWGGTLKWPT